MNKQSCTIAIYLRKRKKAVVCVCISGIGTAEKIKDIMKDFVQPEYELLTCDYMKIMKEGKTIRYFMTMMYNVWLEHQIWMLQIWIVSILTIL